MVWRWLADWWPNLVTAAGLAVTLWGTVLAWLAATEDYKTYGGNPLFPRLTAINNWIRHVILRRDRNITVHAASAAGAMSMVGTATATGYRGVPADAPLEDQVQWLRERVDDLQSDLIGVRSSVGEAEKRLTEQIGEVHADSQRRDQELSEKIREVATSTVKRELKGLMLVGVGSILSALPALVA